MARTRDHYTLNVSAQDEPRAFLDDDTRSGTKGRRKGKRLPIQLEYVQPGINYKLYAVDLAGRVMDPSSMVKRTQGMNWIRPAKRLAIYMRDGFACVYCGQSVEDEITLTLDHLKPYSKGGNHHETNLVTCCGRCNSSRGNRSVASFVRSVCEYLGDSTRVESVMIAIRRNRTRKLNVSAAKALIALRGGFVNAVNGAK